MCIELLTLVQALQQRSAECRRRDLAAAQRSVRASAPAAQLREEQRQLDEALSRAQQLARDEQRAASSASQLVLRADALQLHLQRAQQLQSANRAVAESLYVLFVLFCFSSCLVLF